MSINKIMDIETVIYPSNQNVTLQHTRTTAINNDKEDSHIYGIIP